MANKKESRALVKAPSTALQGEGGPWDFLPGTAKDKRQLLTAEDLRLIRIRREHPYFVYYRGRKDPFSDPVYNYYYNNPDQLLYDIERYSRYKAFRIQSKRPHEDIYEYNVRLQKERAEADAAYEARRRSIEEAREAMKKAGIAEEDAKEAAKPVAEQFEDNTRAALAVQRKILQNAVDPTDTALLKAQISVSNNQINAALRHSEIKLKQEQEQARYDELKAALERFYKSFDDQ